MSFPSYQEVLTTTITNNVLGTPFKCVHVYNGELYKTIHVPIRTTITYKCYRVWIHNSE